MRTVSIVKTGLGSGAAILLAGFLAAAPAQASTGGSVPCRSAALIAAITAANAAGGGAINLTPMVPLQADGPDHDRQRGRAAAGHHPDRGERQQRHDRRDRCCPRL